MNGTDFKQMSHAEAVTLMRNAWNVIMKVQSAASYRQGKSVNQVEDSSDIGSYKPVKSANRIMGIIYVIANHKKDNGK